MHARAHRRANARHSSHHPKGIEVYRGKPLIYGCGDFLSDYEGIAGYEEFRNDLAVMYLPSLATTSGQLVNFRLIPFQIRKVRLNGRRQRTPRGCGAA